MSRSRDLLPGLVAALGSLLFAACGETQQEALPVEPRQEVVTASLAASRRILTCPVAPERSVRATIGPHGGTLSLQGNSIHFPPGAILLPAEVTLTVPASPRAEIDVKVNGRDGFRLARPVLATISYDRCDGLPSAAGKTAWYVDASGQLVEPMSSFDDPASRSVSFITNHFSGYVLINN